MVVVVVLLIVVVELIVVLVIAVVELIVVLVVAVGEMIVVAVVVLIVAVVVIVVFIVVNDRGEVTIGVVMDGWMDRWRGGVGHQEKELKRHGGEDTGVEGIRRPPTFITVFPG